MVKRIRPRVTRASKLDQWEALSQAKEIVWKDLPSVMLKAGELARDGQVQVVVAYLRIVEKLLSDTASRREDDIIDRIANLRKESLERIKSLNGIPDRPQADMDTAGGDGAINPSP